MNIAPIIVPVARPKFSPKIQLFRQSNTLSFGLVFTMICLKRKKNYYK
jgi:hypothetical protein